MTLYFQTTLVLEDPSGTPFHIRPLGPEAASADPSGLLSPYQHAFILTAENPESLGDYTPAQNAEATAQLRRLLESSGHPFRECPGLAWDSEHVEAGFAILATDDNAAEMHGYAIDLAKGFRQNAIFHLEARGLEILGALRDDLAAIRPVIISPS